MSDDQIEALDRFYLGVGLVSKDPKFNTMLAQGFGSWKFYQHIMSVNVDGLVSEEVTELQTVDCFSNLDNFDEPSKAAERIIERQEILKHFICVDKSKM